MEDAETTKKTTAPMGFLVVSVNVFPQYPLYYSTVIITLQALEACLQCLHFCIFCIILSLFQT